jgi:hypothetical protein
MRAFARRFVLALWAFVCAAALTVSLWPSAEMVRTEDQNHDGRPDIWRFYDRHGQLTRVEFDTNFDGRSDRRDYYRDGTLTRSESDRNFDNRIDLIEEFDVSGRQHVRSIVDADFDGAADLLVLFQDGRPVHTEWSTPTPHLRLAGSSPESLSRGPQPGRTATGTLAELDDPFSTSAAFRAHHRARAPDVVGLSGCTIMLKVPAAVIGRPGIAPAQFEPALAQVPRSTPLLSLPARAPPLQRSFS